jgi:hypothetical protein
MRAAAIAAPVTVAANKHLGGSEMTYTPAREEAAPPGIVFRGRR